MTLFATLIAEAEINLRTPKTKAILTKWSKLIAGRGYNSILFSNLDTLIQSATKQCADRDIDIDDKDAVRKCCIAAVIGADIAPADMHQEMADDLVPLVVQQKVSEATDDFDITAEDIAVYARVVAGMVKAGETIKTRKQFDQLAAEVFDDDPLNMDPGQRLEVGRKTWELIQRKQKEGQDKNVDWRDLFESKEGRIEALKREKRRLDLAGEMHTTLAYQGTLDDGDALDHIDKQITVVTKELIDDFPKEETDIRAAAALYRSIRAKHGKNASKQTDEFGASHVNHDLNTRRHEIAVKIHAFGEKHAVTEDLHDDNKKRLATVAGYENAASALHDMIAASKDSGYPELWLQGARRAAKEFARPT